MTMKKRIPDNEVENFISIYWQLLRELEENATSAYDKKLVEGAYTVLNRCEITNARPNWEN